VDFGGKAARYPTFEDRAKDLIKVDDLPPLFRPAFKVADDR
jgi:hypothetical protein